jgi:DNA-directed RNA polymerase subunit F
MGQKSLEQQIKDLVDNASSSGKVVNNIKQEIAETKDELYDNVKDHEIYNNYGIEFNQDELELLYNAGGDFEDIIFNRAIEASSYTNSVSDLDMTTVETVVHDVNDLGRTVRKARRKIAHLERLLK